MTTRVLLERLVVWAWLGLERYQERIVSLSLLVACLVLVARALPPAMVALGELGLVFGQGFACLGLPAWACRGGV